MTTKRNLNTIDDIGVTIQPYSLGLGSFIKRSVAGIDGLTTGKTTLYTPPLTATNFLITQAFVELTSVTGVANAGILKIIDDTASIDLITNVTLTGLTTVGKAFPLILPAAIFPVVPGGHVIRAEITTPFSVATVVTLSIHLIGIHV